MDREKFITDKQTIDELFRSSKKYRNSVAFIKFFNFIAKFNHYSRFNSMLIFLQDESVIFFGSSKFWQNNYNRRVKEGARPYIVLQPFGPVMVVFDIFSTEGKETHDEFLIRELGSKPFDVQGLINPEILNNAILETKKFGIKVTYKSLSYIKSGSILINSNDQLEIFLNIGLSYEQNFATLIHELGHLFLGHLSGDLSGSFVENAKGKQMKINKRQLKIETEELEAETVSFLICKKLGLETRSAEYLAGYINSEKDLEEFSYESVIKTADKIEEVFLKKAIKKYLN